MFILLLVLLPLVLLAALAFSWMQAKNVCKAYFSGKILDQGQIAIAMVTCVNGNGGFLDKGSSVPEL